MGMSTSVIGFRPPDEKWRTMKAIFDNCTAAKIDPPREVWEFFNWTSPQDAGVEVKLPTREWSDDMREGFELKVAEIPKDVTLIRFFNSW